MEPKARFKQSSLLLGGTAFGEILHEALACCHVCTCPLSKGAKDGHAGGPSHTGICSVHVRHREGDMYLLYLSFVWASDGAEQEGAQMQALPHGPDQISSCLAAARRGA